MPVITINKVLNGVTRTLNNHFPEVRIYNEETPQDLNPPAFYVKLLTMNQDQDLGPRYWRYHTFDIHYFDPNYSNVACHEVAEQLYEHLRLIEIDGYLYRGISMNHEIVDRVLHFFVDYNFMVRRDEPEKPKMEELDLVEGIKGDMVPAWLSWKPIDLTHRIKSTFDLSAPSTDLLNEIFSKNIWVSR